MLGFAISMTDGFEGLRLGLNDRNGFWDLGVRLDYLFYFIFFADLG